MDLTNMIPGGAGEEKTPQQQLSKEEYAAMKKQQREEVWAEVDAQAQAVFQNGDSLKGFLDFMAQCNTQKTPNLLLIYGQNPEATVVKSYDYWKKEHRSPKSGVHGYTYMVSTEYEKDGEMRTGYAIGKGFDISQMSGKPLEERPQRSMEELIHAVLKDQPVRMQIADNLPEGIQAQYIPKQRTVYVCNGMDENSQRDKSYGRSSGPCSKGSVCSIDGRRRYGICNLNPHCRDHWRCCVYWEFPEQRAAECGSPGPYPGDPAVCQ